LSRIRSICAAGAVSLIAISPARAAPGAVCDRADFRIAIDVGHTAEAKGATSARGVPEHAFNLALASEIAEMLDKAGYPTLLIIVHGRGHWQLLQRTSEARDFGAQLFLSIHHDDVQLIYKSSWVFDGHLRSYSDLFSGYSLFVSPKNAQYEASIVFARLLGKELRSRGFKFTKHHAENIPGERRVLIDDQLGIYNYDDLVVLRDAPSPAVLLEAGVISNRADELALNSSERRREVANSVLSAVNVFCQAASSGSNR
jgi:N-acetylmuramoyl-L-alanine amidase